MKKLIKKKLFYQNGCSKNLFLWQTPSLHGDAFEIVEEFKGRRISRSMLRGLYREKLKALLAFKRIIDVEASRVPLRSIAWTA